MVRYSGFRCWKLCSVINIASSLTLASDDRCCKDSDTDSSLQVLSTECNRRNLLLTSVVLTTPLLRCKVKQHLVTVAVFLFRLPLYLMLNSLLAVVTGMTGYIMNVIVLDRICISYECVTWFVCQMICSHLLMDHALVSLVVICFLIECRLVLFMQNEHVEM